MPAHMIARMEEDPTWWFERAACTPEQAIAEAHSEDNVGPLTEPGEWEVRPVFMRPWSEADCPSATHDEAAQERDCECAWKRDEGWQMECPEDHPAAVPAWRVEWTG